MNALTLRTLVILGFALVNIAGNRAEAKKHTDTPVSESEKLAIAAENCDMATLQALISSGVSGSTTNANGWDALSRASLNRKNMGLKNKKKDWWTLKCPAAVAALTHAGADPLKAKFYQNPELDERRPQMIAVLRIGDNREQKGDSDKLIDEMTDAVETQLHNGHHLGYPIIQLSDVRQKLLASGFSAQETMAPDRAKACQVLGVDSVFEGSLENFKKASAGIASSAGMGLKFILTDCRTQSLLWSSDQEYTLSLGFLANMGAGKLKKVITGFAGEPALGFPVYEKDR